MHELLLQMKGEAEAFAVEAKGRAEAEQMNKKAEAFKQYKEGAMVDMLLEKLPLVRAASKYPRVECGDGSGLSSVYSGVSANRKLNLFKVSLKKMHHYVYTVITRGEDLPMKQQ